MMTTENDANVLQSIFNPFLPLGEEFQKSSATDFVGEADHHGEDADDMDAIKMERDGVHAAETGNLNDALEKLTRAIELAPKRASLFNNRAQAFRIKGMVEEAGRDLDVAIELTGGRGYVAALAFTQRGTIRQLTGNNDGALKDYKNAAALGNEFAKQQTILLNPMAAMCNKMLSEMMSKLRQAE